MSHKISFHILQTNHLQNCFAPLMLLFNFVYCTYIYWSKFIFFFSELDGLRRKYLCILLHLWWPYFSNGKYVSFMSLPMHFKMSNSTLYQLRSRLLWQRRSHPKYIFKNFFTLRCLYFISNCCETSTAIKYCPSFPQQNNTKMEVTVDRTLNSAKSKVDKC